MNSLFNFLDADFFFTMLRVTTPILFASLAAIIANKAGVVNIALEGIMLVAALFGVIGSGMSQNLIVGLLCALASGLVMSFILAYFSLYLKTDIVLSGIALNMLAIGGTIFILYTVSGDKGVSTNIPSLVFPSLSIPLIKDIPFLGQILSGHNVLTYFAFILVFLVYLLLYKTPFGLRLRSVGENENAASSVGINVKRIQLSALLLSGFIASFGGAYMSMGYLSNFSKNMISGRGYIALAAEAMGQSSPLGTMFSSMLFGATEALTFSMQSFNIPAEFIRMIPYISTIIGLVAYSIINKKRIQNKKRKVIVNKND